MVRIPKQYVFEGTNGLAELRELFEGRRRLIVYQFPFDPAWDDCASSSHLADNLAAGIVHLPARDTSFAAVSRVPIATIESCRNRLGWTFPWLSSLDNDFNEDFRVRLEDAPAETNDEWPGVSVFLRDGRDVFHTYSTYQRRVDVLLDTYDSPDGASVRRRDRLPPQRAHR